VTCSNANPNFLGVSSNGVARRHGYTLDSPCAGAADQAGSGIGVGQRQSLLELGEHGPDRPCHPGVAVVGLFGQLAAGYLRRVATSPVVAFHAGRRQITERVLNRACSSGGDACDWLAAAVPDGGRVLDLAGGSAPPHPRLPGRECTGVDLSAAELALARRHVAVRLAVCASASALPLARHVTEPRGPFSPELGASSRFGLRDGEPDARFLRMAMCVDGFASTSAS
jgi:hypothetical protein